MLCFMLDSLLTFWIIAWNKRAFNTLVQTIALNFTKANEDCDGQFMRNLLK